MILNNDSLPFRPFYALALLVLLASVSPLGVSFAAGLGVDTPTALSPKAEPDVLLKAASARLLQRLRDEREELVGNQAALSAVVTETVVPLMDFKVITRLILGKRYRRVSVAQRERFETEFRKMLLRTYTAPLLKYAGDIAIDYQPAVASPRADRRLVKTVLTYKGSRKIPVNYFFKKSTGEHSDERPAWQVYDIRILGISAVGMFRSVFERDIERLGVDGFLNEMAKRQDRDF